MDTSQYDARIAQAQREIDGVRSRMEAVTRDFVSETKGFAAQWMRDQVHKSFVAQSDTSKAMDKDRVASLKADLETLAQQVPGLVEQELLQDELWPHRRQSFRGTSDDYMEFFSGGRRAPERIDLKIRRVVGHAGRLLSKYGLAKLDTQFGDWKRQHDNTLIYATSLEISPQMLDILKSYTSLVQEYTKARYQVERAEREKAEAEAADLWNRA